MNDMPLNFQDDVDVWDGLLGTQGSVDNSELIMLDCFDPMDGDISTLLDDYDPNNSAATAEGTYAGDFSSKCNEWDDSLRDHQMPIEQEATLPMNMKRSRKQSFGDQRRNKRQRRDDADVVSMDVQGGDQQVPITPNTMGADTTYQHPTPELSSEAFNQKFEGMLSKLALSMQRSEMSRSRVLGTANHVNHSQRSESESQGLAGAVASASGASFSLAAGLNKGRTHFRSYLSHFKTL